MAKSGYAFHRADLTQPAFVEAFTKAGWSVMDSHRIGGGVPDLFVAKRGVTIAIECKTGKEKRRDNQVVWESKWNGLYLWGSNPLELLEQAEKMLTERER